MYNEDQLNDPFLLFEARTKKIKERLRVLIADFDRVQHYMSKAIIMNEIEELIDDYVERSIVLSKQKEED